MKLLQEKEHVVRELKNLIILKKKKSNQNWKQYVYD